MPKDADGQRDQLQRTLARFAPATLHQHTTGRLKTDRGGFGGMDPSEKSSKGKALFLEELGGDGR